MLPKVAIIGRPNVGKSSLLNMLVGRRISIVDATEGVTRDRVSTELELPGHVTDGEPRYCELVDTGGWGVYSGDDEQGVLTDHIEDQIRFAVDEAALVLFVVDARSGLTPLDEQVAKLLRRRAGDLGRVVLVANKVDDERHESLAAEAMALGFGEPRCVSATTRRGMTALLASIADRLGDSATATPSDDLMKLAIVGKRNAGKSTLVNALAGAERVITSQFAGTTRDSVDVRFELHGRALLAIDTAGARKRKSMHDDLEYYSLHRALRSIRRSDVVLLVVDATTDVSQVDKKLAAHVMEHYKPAVIVINKWDLVSDRVSPQDYTDYLEQQLGGLRYAPLAFISATQREGIVEVIDTACLLYEQAGQRVSTGQLNTVMQKILADRGPTPRLGRQAKVYYVTMPSNYPPTIVLFVNDPSMFDQRYQRYLMNRFRELLPFGEVPIKLIIRPRRREDRNAPPVAVS